MKNAVIKYIPVILLSTTLFVMGKFVFTDLFSFFEPTINGIQFQIIELDGKLKTSLLFSLAVAFIPVLILLTWRLAPIILLYRKLAVVATTLIFIAAAIFVRHVEVKSYFTYLIKKANLLNGKTTMLYPIDPVNFVYYIIAGLCAGCIVSYFLYRQKKFIHNTSPN